MQNFFSSPSHFRSCGSHLHTLCMVFMPGNSTQCLGSGRILPCQNADGFTFSGPFKLYSNSFSHTQNAHISISIQIFFSKPIDLLNNGPFFGFLGVLGISE